MPSIAEAAVSSKKRRRDDDSNGFELQTKMSKSNTHHPRRPYEGLPLRYDTEITPDLQAYPRRTTISPKCRRPQDSKRQRIVLSDHGGRDVYLALERRADTTAELHGNTIIPSEEQEPRAVGSGSGSGSAKVDLSRCHVCRRKPTVKSELDAFGDCQCCGERTCYICMRKCEGSGVVRRASSREKHTPHPGLNGDCDSRMMGEDASPNEMLGMGMGDAAEDESGAALVTGGKEADGRSGHRDRICSSCCEERGAEGVIWCFGCLGAEEAG